ncbi:MAG: DUF3048 domain-containing protein [Actinomycetota bacterium]
MSSTKHARAGNKRSRLTRRGKIIAGAGGLAVGIVALSSILALAGKDVQMLNKVPHFGNGAPPPPPTCPLTGGDVKEVPARPALGIKVENIPEARPQAGLNKADIVYEEPVEGGITRFIVIYQCQDSDRVGPVRSARLTDANVLSQYGHPVFGYAGGVPSVEHAVDAAGVKDENYDIAVSAYTRDENRSEPHNLYTTTEALWKAARLFKAPDPVFEYGDLPEHVKKAGFAHIDFSGVSDVYWRWDVDSQTWLRYHGTDAHLLEGDVQVSAKNVVVQIVKTQLTGTVDAAGNPSPEAITVGGGKAYVFRGGKVIIGTWVRQSPENVTEFRTKSGDVIPLAPGRTWVELYPEDRPPVEIGKK